MKKVFGCYENSYSFLMELHGFGKFNATPRCGSRSGIVELSTVTTRRVTMLQILSIDKKVSNLDISGP